MSITCFKDSRVIVYPVKEGKNKTVYKGRFL